MLCRHHNLFDMAQGQINKKKGAEANVGVAHDILGDLEGGWVGVWMGMESTNERFACISIIGDWQWTFDVPTLIDVRRYVACRRCRVPNLGGYVFERKVSLADAVVSSPLPLSATQYM